MEYVIECLLTKRLFKKKSDKKEYRKKFDKKGYRKSLAKKLFKKSSTKSPIYRTLLILSRIESS